MDPSTGLSAAEWLMKAEADDIAWVLKTFGEERFAKRIARAIVERNRVEPMTRTKELADLIADASPFREKHKHPATRSFQAIRIYINSELEEIERALDGALEVLACRPFVDHQLPLAGRPHRQTLYASPQPRRSGAGGHSVDRRAAARHGRPDAESAGQNDAVGSGSGGQPACAQLGAAYC